MLFVAQRIQFSVENYVFPDLTGGLETEVPGGKDDVFVGERLSSAVECALQITSLLSHQPQGGGLEVTAELDVDSVLHPPLTAGGGGCA